MYAHRFCEFFEKKFISKAEEVTLTKVLAELFETPMPPFSRSGGTAAFFQTTLLGVAADCPEAAESTHYWVGKDLGRAKDEVYFYELAKGVSSEPGFEFLEWMTPYKGICTARCEIEGQDPKDVQLMLLRNCRDGFRTCRMLDIKIGWATAVSGWQGKGALAAWKQGFVDSATNSVVEGFRLEGFDNPPETLKSFEAFNAKHKMFKRFNLQRMDAFKFLRFWLDLHDIQDSTYGQSHTVEGPVVGDASCLSTVELQELLLLNCIEELAGFVAAARKAATPQQWIGSSVMLAFDSSSRPSREEALQREAPRRRLARVHVFDWGRSELNLPSHHARLTKEEQASRWKSWGFYCEGVAKLLYDCCALYVSRFWQAKASVVFTVWDKDRWSDDDFVGACTAPLVEAGETLHDLLTWEGETVKAGSSGVIGKAQGLCPPRPGRHTF